MDPFTLALVAAAVAGSGVGVARHRRKARRGDASSPPTSPRRRPTPGRTLAFELASAPFPGTGHPSVAVRVPPGFDPTAPLELAVYFRGFGNCVTTLIGPRAAPCRPGGPTHNTSHLAEQWDGAGRNALLVMPELRIEERTGDPGALRRPGSMAALLDELLGDKLRPLFGAPKGAADVRRLHLMSHSGGYSAVAAVLRQEDLADRVREVVLVDSLYGEQATFTRWILAQAPAILRGEARFGCIYTAGGGTDDHARALAAQARRWFASAPTKLHVNDAARGELARADYGAGVLFHRSKLSHGGTSRYYPARFWATGGFRPRDGVR